MRILIAHADRDFCEMLRKHLSARRMDTEIRLVSSGTELLSFVQNDQPELVIVSTILTDMDGLKAVEKLRTMPAVCQPELIVLSGYSSWVLQKEICAAQPLLYLSLPCDMDWLIERVLNCCREIVSEGSESLEGLKGGSRHLLRECGLTSRSKGFSYIETLLRILYEHGTCSESLTKVLYPAVAKYYHTSAANVERAIRSAIIAAWKREGYLLQKILFHGRPTNSEFLHVLYERIAKLNIDDKEKA